MSQADPALWGFASMFSWGVADMLARYASLRIGSTAVALVVQVLGILPLLAIGLLLNASWSVLLHGDFVAVAGIVALLFSVGYVVFYRGLERGMVSIVSPLSACWLVITTILSAIFFGEAVGPIRWLLITVILVGIVLTSSNGRNGASISGVWYGITAMVVFGLAFTMFKPMVDDAGAFLTVASVKLLSTIFLGTYLMMRKSVRLPMSSRAGLLVLGAGVLDVVGFVTLNLGIEANPVSLIIPIAAAYPAVTMALAWILLRERLTRLQMSGIIAVLAGVVSFSVVT